MGRRMKEEGFMESGPELMVRGQPLKFLVGALQR
jgi:hypothetical protein